MINKNVTEDELCSFIRNLKPKLKITLNTIGDERTSDSSSWVNWDLPARKTIAENMLGWFQECFAERTLGGKWDDCFGYEGQNNKIERTEFFSCNGCYPDMYFLKPIKIAIELDHGKSGIDLKKALGKAGFNKISEDWAKVFLFFLDQTEDKRIEKSISDEGSIKVRQFFLKQLKTEVIVI